VNCWWFDLIIWLGKFGGNFLSSGTKGCDYLALSSIAADRVGILA
jgi:hypothetical protein